MRNLMIERFWCVKHINIFRDLSETDAHALEQITTFKQLTHKERICTEGVYLIKEGRVKIANNSPDTESEKPKNTVKNTDPDEKQQTREVLEQGEIFGVIPNDDSTLDENTPSFAETLSDVRIGVVAIRDFSFFLKRKPHLVLPLKRKISDVFRKVNNTFSYANKNNGNWYFGSSDILEINTKPDILKSNAFSNVAFRCASSRLALLLHNLADTPDSKGVVLVPRLSTKRISMLTGSSTETIETLLKTYMQHNVIKKRRGRIQVMAPWHLRKIADARMKTLTAPPVPETAPDDDFGLELLANLSNEENNQTDSTVSKP